MEVVYKSSFEPGNIVERLQKLDLAEWIKSKVIEGIEGHTTPGGFDPALPIKLEVKLSQ